MAATHGKLIGVGVGPGDPGLITLKAAGYIEQADVISYIVNAQGDSQAKTIARDILARAILTRTRAAAEIPLVMPMSDNRAGANQAYDQAATAIKAAVEQGQSVVFLCEGDPLFFASFGYLLERLQGQVDCEVVPGISSIHAAAATLQQPLTRLRDSFAVVSGRHSEEKIQATLEQYDSVVIIKAGRSRQRILKALAATGRSQQAQYLEYIGRDNQAVVADIGDLSEGEGPYFSLFVVTR